MRRGSWLLLDKPPLNEPIIFMPFSINGVGWTCYGQREFGSDGSFIMTEWFIIFHIPIFPLRSYRAKSYGSESIIGPFYNKENFLLSRPMRPNLKQAACTYAYTLTLIGLGAYVFSNYTEWTERFGTVGTVSGIALGFLTFKFIPYLLARLAIRRAGLKVERRRRQHR